MNEEKTLTMLFIDAIKCWFKLNYWRFVYLCVGFSGLWLWWISTPNNILNLGISQTDKFVYMFGWAGLGIISVWWFIAPALKSENISKRILIEQIIRKSDKAGETPDDLKKRINRVVEAKQ
jgi:hypothetical protein